MLITFTCPQCQNQLEADTSLAGSAAPCPHCNVAVTVPKALAGPGATVGDIGNEVQNFVEGNGMSVVRDFVGHGIGRHLHEEPAVPNFGAKGAGLRLEPGMVIAVEPMVNLGGFAVRMLGNNWTVVTADGKLSAHFEHTLAVTKDGCEILTLS